MKREAATPPPTLPDSHLDPARSAEAKSVADALRMRSHEPQPHAVPAMTGPGEGPAGAPAPPPSAGQPAATRVQIAHIADMRVFRPTLIAMMSALESTAAPVTVHFFGWRLTQEAHGLLERAIQRYPGSVLRYHEIPERMTDSARDKDDKVYSATRLAILHIPQLLEGKVLYLDSDVLVHADIATLFDIDLGDCHIGAVQCFTCLQDHFTQLHQERNKKMRRVEFQRDERLMAPYSLSDRFNAGVLLFNNDVIRSVPGAADALTDSLGLMNDQPILNHHFKGRVFWLHPSWNVASGLHHLYNRMGHAMTDAPNHGVHNPPRISHFLGHAKPWHDFSLTELRQSVQKTRESLCQKLGVTMQGDIDFFFFSLKDEFTVIEYIQAVRFYRKSAERLMHILGEGDGDVAWMRHEIWQSPPSSGAGQRVRSAESRDRSQSGMTGNRRQIAFATDVNYFTPTLVAMASAIEGASAPVDIHFMGFGLTVQHRTRLNAFARRYPETRIHYHGLTPKMLKGAIRHSYWTPTTLAILQVPKLAEGKVLFLDSDLIVSGDVCELFDLDMADFLVAAVRDFSALRQSLDPGNKYTAHRTKLMHPLPLHCYFNSGVVMFNNDSIDQDPEIAGKLKAGVVDNAGDQDILNACFKERALYIDNSWNVMAGFASMYSEIQKRTVPEEIRFRHQRPNALHFTGRIKPWHKFDFDGVTPDSKEIASGDLQCAPDEKCISEYVASVQQWRSIAGRVLRALV